MNTHELVNALLNGKDHGLFTELSVVRQQQIVAILRFEGLLARLACALGDDKITSLSPHIQRHMFSAKLQASRLAHFCQNEAEIIQLALHKKGIVGTFLKGGAYALLELKSLKGRLFTDIDLLVEKKDLKPAELALMGAGWMQKVMDNYDEKYYREWAHEIPPMIHRKRDTVIDLHHNLVPPISGRAPDISTFTQGAVDTENGQVLRPAALVLHSMVHLFTNEEFHNAYRDLNDIHLMLTEFSCPEFWHDLLSLATKSRFEDELYLALIQTQFYFSTAIPDSVLNQTQDTVARKRSRFNLFIIETIYKHAVAPKHPSLRKWQTGLSLAGCFVRGHMVKMPPKVLIKHMTFKIYRITLEYLLGKGFGKETMNKEIKKG